VEDIEVEGVRKGVVSLMELEMVDEAFKGVSMGLVLVEEGRHWSTH
jgi:hypothetical protein